MKSYVLLSDAILDGARLRPQGRGRLVDRHGKTCALGAAVHAVTGEASLFLHKLLKIENFNLILSSVQCCPEESCFNHERSLDACDLIAHLNDRHCWTREQIAAFVATVEERLGLCEIISDEVEQPVKEQIFVTV
jgi:hypothetical protein